MRTGFLSFLLVFTTSSLSAGGLNLEVWNPGQSAQEYKLAVRITNHTGSSVSLNRLKVKFWFHDVASAGIDTSTYSNNQTVYDASGAWIANVDKPMAVVSTIQSSDCGNGRRANKEIVVAFVDATSKVIPPGGYLQSNASSDSLVAWHHVNWADFDRGQSRDDNGCK